MEIPVVAAGPGDLAGDLANPDRSGRDDALRGRGRRRGPRPLLLVVPVLVDGEQRWLNVQRGLTRVYRGTLTKSYGLADPAVLEQVDALLRVAIDL